VASFFFLKKTVWHLTRVYLNNWTGVPYSDLEYHHGSIRVTTAGRTASMRSKVRFRLKSTNNHSVGTERRIISGSGKGTPWHCSKVVIILPMGWQSLACLREHSQLSFLIKLAASNTSKIGEDGHVGT